MPKQPRPVPRSLRRKDAYHEAGDVVALLALGGMRVLVLRNFGRSPNSACRG